MKTKNCPNCGAPYDFNEHKCPYCGTQYFDMSFVDFENEEPFYLKIKTHINGQPVYLTQLVMPSLKSIETTVDEVEYRSGIHNYKIGKCVVSRQLTTNVSFTAVADKKDNLMYIEIAED